MTLGPPAFVFNWPDDGQYRVADLFRLQPLPVEAPQQLVVRILFRNCGLHGRDGLADDCWYVLLFKISRWIFLTLNPPATNSFAR